MFRSTLKNIASETRDPCPKGGRKQMRKFVAIILTLTMVAALLVTPALAAERAVGICSSCNKGGIELISSVESQYDSPTVSSCDYATFSHTHVRYRTLNTYECDRCEYTYTSWSGGTTRTFCGASNMWLGIDIVDQIM